MKRVMNVMQLVLCAHLPAHLHDRVYACVCACAASNVGCSQPYGRLKQENFFSLNFSYSQRTWSFTKEGLPIALTRLVKMLAQLKYDAKAQFANLSRP